MTLDEALKLASERPDRFAAMVASGVMGWEMCLDRNCPGCNHAVTYDGEAWHTYIPDTPITWMPLTSADHDYMVLRRVQHSWDFTRRQRFAAYVDSLWTRRLSAVDRAIVNQECLYSLVEYVPGDWAIAALAACGEVSRG